mmetsp:Transcript_16763/g.46953  ORF Transcript_16763/g.46953 Transcript_16763/m.46953 type:complete len:226 (+) Transcript_16763:153-830(+)
MTATSNTTTMATSTQKHSGREAAAAASSQTAFRISETLLSSMPSSSTWKMPRMMTNELTALCKQTRRLSTAKRNSESTIPSSSLRSALPPSVHFSERTARICLHSITRPSSMATRMASSSASTASTPMRFWHEWNRLKNFTILHHHHHHQAHPSFSIQARTRMVKSNARQFFWEFTDLISRAGLPESKSASWCDRAPRSIATISQMIWTCTSSASRKSTTTRCSP